MNKGIFSSWFREFATLVFTQAVQAFLLAIVMSIIISCLAGANGNGVNAAGLLAIIALSSFGKIELLVKNIFGVTSGYGDPSMRNGRGITAMGALAYKGGMRLADNFTKAGDAKRMIEQGKMGLRKTEAGQLNANNPGGSNSDSEKDDSNYKDEHKDTDKEIGDEIKEEVVRLETMGDIQALTEAIRRLSTETAAANRSNTQEKVAADKEKYEKMIQDGQDMKRSAVRENVLGAIGGVGGAIVGLAQGEDIAQTTLAGAGIGDAIGAASANRRAKKDSHNRQMDKLTDEFNKNVKNYNEKVQKNIESIMEKGGDPSEYASDAIKSYNNIMSQAEKNIGKATSRPSSREVKNKMKDVDKIIKEAQRNIDKQSNAGN